MSELKAQIYNIQHFSTEDGPGIRTTVFFQGCPLSCEWCANPESQKMHKQLAYRKPICIKCGSCIKACEEGALSVEDGAVVIDHNKCSDCGKCVEACPSHAMFYYGYEKSVDDIFKEIMKDKGYYESSGGGVSCSGGECMMQYKAVAEIFRLCKEEGIHTALDTCGFCSYESFESVLPYTDLLLYDIKGSYSDVHKKYTGVDNDLIRENLKKLVLTGKEIWIRMPLIPGINDSDEDLNNTAEFIKELNPSLHIDILPYHRFGENKYKMLGKPYLLTGLNAPDETEKERYEHIFTILGLDVKVH